MRGKSASLLLVLALFTLLAVVGVWTQITPQYQARGELRVRPIIPRLVFKTEDNGPIPFYDGFVNTQVSIMRSQSALGRVLDRTEVRDTAWYTNSRQSFIERKLGTTAQPMQRLLKGLSVRPRRRTEIIDISFTCASAEEAATIVDAVLYEYLIEIGSSLSEETKLLAVKLKAQYDALKNEVDGLEAGTRLLRRRLGTANPQELISAERLRLVEAQGRLSDLQKKIAILEWEIENTNAADSNEAVVDAPGTLEHQLARSKYEKMLLDEESKKQERKFASLFTDAGLLEEQNRELRQKRELFDAVRQRREQIAVEKDVPASISRIGEKAFEPSEPHNDRRLLYTATALGLYLVVGGSIVRVRRRRVVKAGKGQ